MEPLRGIRIVSLALNIPGPVAIANLRARGASVIKIEPSSGDPLAIESPAWYAELTRGINVFRLELKDAAARTRLETWLAAADLLMTSMRPSALQRLGLQWGSLHARHPRLCHVAIVGYPAPREDVPGHDLTYQAEAGLLSPPSLPQTLVADLAGAERAVSAALALLMGRDRGDGAQYAEVSLAESARLFAEPLMRGLTTPTGALGGGLTTYALYRARDGWIAVAALEPRFRETLAQALGVAMVDSDGLMRLFASRSAQEWQQWAETCDLPIVAVRGPAGSNLSDGQR